MIAQSHERCEVCEMIDDIDPNAAAHGVFYIAGLIHGALTPQRTVRLCPLHYDAWHRIDSHLHERLKSA